MLGRLRQLHGEIYLLPESRHPRFFLLGNYTSFAIAGVFCLIYASPSMEGLLPSWGKYVWGGFYCAGGIFGVIGVLKRVVAWGVVAFPLLVSASAIYVVALIYRFFEAGSGIALIISALITAQTCNLIDRWVGVTYLFKALQDKRIKTGDDGLE